LLFFLRVLLGGLIRVAFFIVVERKGLGHFQLRQGPNKPRIKGIAQALADGVKLMLKGCFFPGNSEKYLFFLGPFLIFSFRYGFWLIFPCYHSSIFYERSIAYYMCLVALGVYGVFICGWRRNSSYALLGAMRALAQRISYEVVLGTLILCPCLYSGGLRVNRFLITKGLYGGLRVEIFFLWMAVLLAETNRAPFDFVEGESELVAGFNVEFGGFGFALIALAEYGRILFSRVLTGVLFFGRFFEGILSGVLIRIWGVFLSYLFILVRATFPRFRYDKLISFSWKGALPLSLGLLRLSLFEFSF